MELYLTRKAWDYHRELHEDAEPATSGCIRTCWNGDTWEEAHDWPVNPDIRFRIAERMDGSIVASFVDAHE